MELFPRVPVYFEPENEKEAWGVTKGMPIDFDLFCQMQVAAAKETADYMLKNFKQDIRVARNRFEQMDFLINEEVDDSLGAFAEFGVYKGESINFMAAMKPTQIFYGFDSFEGLPETWMSVSEEQLNLNGNVPEVLPNVCLYKGWFDETIPKFLKDESRNFAFIHIDSDLYSSAKTVLFSLKERIVPGTVILFDEYFNYPTWQEHEFKAFQEFIEYTSMNYKYISYLRSYYASVAVRIE